MLDAAAAAAGYRLAVFDSLGSTNQDALARARAGDPGRLWIQALAQTEGRGRRGRLWASPPGNLYVSLLLVDPAEAHRAAEIGFVAGLALARAVQRLPALAGRVHIKWPNDLVSGAAKLAGILVEGTQVPAGGFACAVGFGVNCRSHPSGVEYPTTDLSCVSGTEISASTLLNLLSSAMVDAVRLWNRGTGFAAVREAWLGSAMPAGSPLTVRTPTSTMNGFFDTIDNRGRLILRTDAGPWTVDAADVFLTPQDLPARSHKGETNE